MGNWCSELTDGKAAVGGSPYNSDARGPNDAIDVFSQISWLRLMKVAAADGTTMLMKLFDRSNDYDVLSLSLSLSLSQTLSIIYFNLKNLTVLLMIHMFGLFWSQLIKNCDDLGSALKVFGEMSKRSVVNGKLYAFDC